MRGKLRSFTAFRGDSPESYKYVVLPFQFGHIFARYKGTGPVQVRLGEAEAFSLVTLGFHDFCYEALGPDSLDPLAASEGEFVSLLLDRTDETVHIVNDRFSARPFYWVREGDTTAFSSNLLFLADLLGLPCRPDVLGWFEIFSYSHTLGERTNFEGVRRLPPASHLTVSRGGTVCRRYWRLMHETRHDLDAVEHAERTFAALQRSTAARAKLSEEGFVSLSGGLDSRLVAGTLPAESKFHLFTFGGCGAGEETADVKAARQIAAALNQPHRVAPLAEAHVSAVAEDAVRLTGGLTTLQHPAKTFGNLREMIAGAGFKLGGGPGDSLASGFASGSIHNIRPEMADRQVYKFIVGRKKLSRGALRQIWRRDVVEAFYPKLDECMAECFASLSGETAAHRIAAWAMAYRQPAFTFTSPIHNHPDVTEASPHLGYDYADCMVQLPAEWIYQKNFYKFMVWHCLPELREVVYANTGKKLSGEIVKYTVSPRKRAFSFVERCIPAAWVEYVRRAQSRPSPQKTLEYRLLQSDTKLLREIREMLHSFGALGEMLDIEACDDFLKRFESGVPEPVCPAHDAEIVGGLATLCYWYACVNQ